MNQNSPARSKARKWILVGLGLGVAAGASAYATFSPAARPIAAITPETPPSMRLVPGSTNTLDAVVLEKNIMGGDI